MKNRQNSPIHSPTPEAIAEAGALLRAGELIGIPTETVYGLAGDATDDRAVARIFAAKDRPSFNPLIIHVAKIAAAREIVRFDARAENLAARFWPGPLTLVLPRIEGCAVSLLAGAGLDSLALRMPDHETACAVIAAAGRPLAAPSANPSGKVSPTAAAHVAEALAGRIAMVLDGGPCRVGLESTVLDLTGPRAILLRPGGLPKEEIEAVLGPLAEAGSDSGAPRGPGQLASHYAPAPASERRNGEAGRGPDRLRPGCPRRCGGDPQSQPYRRSGRGRRQSLRHDARPRPVGIPRHRRDDDPGNRAWPGHQRPPAPRRRAAQNPRER